MNQNEESLSDRVEKKKAKEEFEKKFFPQSLEKQQRKKIMNEPKLFEEQLKQKLRKCLIKDK
jgi:hypothetical protein